jgi:hypothetical protein
MPPLVQQDEPVSPTSNQDSSLHIALSTISLTEHKSDDGQPSPAQRPPPLPPRKDASSSTISLGPSGIPQNGRRKLLLIYIHGFMGAEDSFRTFPAHVHNLVASALADSHVVYSKIYPRYKSRRAMSAARDEFSEWLVNGSNIAILSRTNSRRQADTVRVRSNRCDLIRAQFGRHPSRRRSPCRE